MDPVESFESDRHFQVWLYSVSHAQLLLRSVKTVPGDRRIDVLFKGVDRMDVPTSFDRLRITRTGRHYEMSGSEWHGQVMALACFVAEDDSEYYDPSPFVESLP